MEKCLYCPEEFMTEEDVVRHVFSVHGDQFQMGAAQMAEIAGRQIFAGKLTTAASVAANLTATYFASGKRKNQDVEEIVKIHNQFSKAVMSYLTVEELTADLEPIVQEMTADGESNPTEG